MEKKNLKVTVDSLNAWQQSLINFIKQYHPYKLYPDVEQDTIKFIVLRAENAANAYNLAFEEGKNPLECKWAGNEVLFAGLEFSPIKYLIEICRNETGYEMEIEEACEMYKNPLVQEILERFGPEIEGSDKEYLCVQELIPFFKLHEGKVIKPVSLRELFGDL